MAGALSLDMLPEDCISTIIALTSPADACNTSSLSSSFRLAAESNIVWDKFLPTNHREIIARSVIPLRFSSKKELFFQLCNTILIDSGKLSFSLDKLYGKIAYVLSARELSILHSNEQSQWSWESNPDSRFTEVINLSTTAELEIQGKINTRTLSQNTKYGAYLIMQISKNAYGLSAIPCEISIRVDEHEQLTNTAHLRKKQQMECLFYPNSVQMLKKRVCEGEDRVPNERKDGLMEIEMGQFLTGSKDEDVKMSLMEVKGNQLKGGLITQGIEFRPKG